MLEGQIVVSMAILKVMFFWKITFTKSSNTGYQKGFYNTLKNTIKIIESEIVIYNYFLL